MKRLSLIVISLLFFLSFLIGCNKKLKSQGNTFKAAGITSSRANGKVFTMTFEFEKKNTDYHNKAYIIVKTKGGKKGHFYYADKFSSDVDKMKKDQLYIIKFKVKEAAGVPMGQVDGFVLGIQPVNNE